MAGRKHREVLLEASKAYTGPERERLLLFLEPEARNTAPAIAWGLEYVEREARGEDRSILVLTGDHIICPMAAFIRDARAVDAFARQGNLAVFGIVPQSPETGYGYIEAGEALAVPGDPAGDAWASQAFRVLRFREKPDRETAEKFLAAGNFYWNSGMFAFSSSFLEKEFKAVSPEVLAPFEELVSLKGHPLEGPIFETLGGLRVLKDWPGLEEAYRKAPSISFDYALAEKCRKTVVVPATFKWTDVGSWDEYARLREDPDGKPGGEPGAEVYRYDSPGCFVDSDIPVALCGVEDLIVVVRSGKDGNPPAVLVAKKGTTQGLRNIVEEIKMRKKSSTLL
jgi:mannose-1-phosphate guanylyltransferase